METLHFDRLFSGLALLDVDSSSLSEAILRQHITELCIRNGCAASARVRLEVYRDEQTGCGWLAEALAVDTGYRWNDSGYTIDVFSDGRKQADSYSHLKSANYLLYALAARSASARPLDEALVLNGAGRICDGARTNVFIVSNGKIVTPPLSEGCIAGVMRRLLLERLPEAGFIVSEDELSIDRLAGAEAVFLTNAIRGVQWVGRFRDSIYAPEPVYKIYNILLSTMTPGIC
ncbi:MAG: hypothetical protein JWP27_3015 [Flaviaesturariibacter sp.]|nr:hypothetical protein [Flaviaesturariibacter sp.]